MISNPVPEPLHSSPGDRAALLNYWLQNPGKRAMSYDDARAAIPAFVKYSDGQIAQVAQDVMFLLSPEGKAIYTDDAEIVPARSILDWIV